jgi:hypothetical protein
VDGDFKCADYKHRQSYLRNIGLGQVESGGYEEAECHAPVGQIHEAILSRCAVIGESKTRGGSNGNGSVRKGAAKEERCAPYE